jgi:anti-sigma factor RsiW
MQQRNDERLLAYLDGELEMAERREVEAWLESDPEARERLAALANSANLVRLAFDPVIHEAVPERLIAAARGERAPTEAEVIALPPPRRIERRPSRRRWWLAAPVAASLAGLMLGGSAGYFGAARFLTAGTTPTGGGSAVVAAAANDVWLDNAAGYFKLFVRAGDGALVDVPATGDTQAALEKISHSLPQALRLPDLKPWGLNFRGARLVVVEGRPAAQLVYTTDNKAIGPLTLIIGSSKKPDIAPTFDRRQDVNVLYWRHQGRAYALVGQADIGYLWGIANDVAWQLDAI